MYYFRKNPVFNSPVLIDDGADARRAIESFLTDYRLGECRQLLWNLYEVAITTDNNNFPEPEHREEITLFIHEIQKLLESVFILYGEAKA